MLRRTLLKMLPTGLLAAVTPKWLQPTGDQRHEVERSYAVFCTMSINGMKLPEERLVDFVRTFTLYRDGNAWCCIQEPRFINLHESTAGFGDTVDEAIEDFLKNDKAEAAQRRAKLLAEFQAEIQNASLLG